MNLIKRVFIRVVNRYKQWRIRHCFNGACFEDIVLGPELDKRFDVRHPENLKIGNKTAISGDLFINALGGVKIGHHCHIAKGLTIYSHNHNWKSEEFVPYDSKNILKPVEIGNCVWIGCNVTIAPGVKIGDGVIISSGSVVFGEVPRCAIIRGNPAEIIGYRNIDNFDRLYREEKFV